MTFIRSRWNLGLLVDRSHKVLYRGHFKVEKDPALDLMRRDRRGPETSKAALEEAGNILLNSVIGAVLGRIRVLDCLLLDFFRPSQSFRPTCDVEVGACQDEPSRQTSGK